MSLSLIQSVVSKHQQEKEVPRLKSGLTVKVHQKIQEGNKERIQVFEGVILKIHRGPRSDTTFTVRKVVENVGVEKVFPLYSPSVAKIEIVKEARVRRARLYYMRKRFGKMARLKEQHVSVKAQISPQEAAQEAV